MKTNNIHTLDTSIYKPWDVLVLPTNEKDSFDIFYYSITGDFNFVGRRDHLEKDKFLQMTNEKRRIYLGEPNVPMGSKILVTNPRFNHGGHFDAWYEKGDVLIVVGVQDNCIVARTQRQSPDSFHRSFLYHDEYVVLK